MLLFLCIAGVVVAEKKGIIDLRSMVQQKLAERTSSSAEPAKVSEPRNELPPSDKPSRALPQLPTVPPRGLPPPPPGGLRRPPRPGTVGAAGVAARTGTLEQVANPAAGMEIEATVETRQAEPAASDAELETYDF